MKVLFVATVRSHIGQFHMPFIKALCDAGHTVEAAFKDNSNDKQGLDLSIINKTYEIPFERSPLKLKNIVAYKELKKVINEGNYDVIHCHTPMGAVITRLAARKARKKGTKVFYTAHGFHFYKGASKKNWLLFYPVEKYLSKFTDCLILINQEDYELAISKKFRAKRIEKTHGVGVDLSNFCVDESTNYKKLRLEYGYSLDDFILIYPADLSIRKNQTMLFKAIKLVKSDIPKIKLLLPGQQILLDKYKSEVKEYGIEDCVEFLGYRRDIPKLLGFSDVAVSSSRQEGLPINIVEAMAMGKPIVATNVRGNSDLVDNEKGGYLVDLNDSASMAEKLKKLYTDKEMCIQMGLYNLNNVTNFSVEKVNEEIKSIYNQYGDFF